MTAALERLLTNPELADRLKTRASQLILERHQPDARMRKLAAIYRQLP
jgi:glycosyltransferase involved in cell wall biosynthesis